ncbi:MAG: phosphoenolpyruvate carboxylase, partial [Undibacterium sp.]|nr:phosphoenolpyruvate carboxylase [Undibacterium sp.]
MNNQSDDKDQSLRDDIRRLGRILGDTVRSQHGEEMFTLIETVRQNSIRFRRDADNAARDELERTLDTLSNDQSTHLIRAFSYFSHLVNLAEDQHHVRRSRAHLIAGSPPKAGSIAHTVDTLFEAGNAVEILKDFFQSAQVTPVLTAHPTEVQRKSILNCQMVITRLLDERDRMQLTPEESQHNDEALQRAVLTLWQTRMLRTKKLSVLDEVENGLSFYDYTFLKELPQLYVGLEDLLASKDKTFAQNELPSFMQMGTWIGGDRDGNPFVTASVLEQTLVMQATR